MNELLKSTEQDREVFRHSGIAGLLAGALLLIAMAFVAAMLPPDPEELTQWVNRFPDLKTTRIIENGTYLAGLILAIPLFLGIFWSLRKTSLAFALTGTALTILGISAMTISSTPHVAHSPLSTLYHTAESTAASQATLGLMWQATWGVFNAMLYVGFLIVSTGLIALGIATFKSPFYGKGISWLVVALGTAGLIAAVLQIIDPVSPIGGVSYIACIAAVLLLGWKLFTLSRIDKAKVGQSGTDQARFDQASV